MHVGLPPSFSSPEGCDTVHLFLHFWLCVWFFDVLVLGGASSAFPLFFTGGEFVCVCERVWLFKCSVLRYAFGTTYMATVLIWLDFWKKFYARRASSGGGVRGGGGAGITRENDKTAEELLFCGVVVRERMVREFLLHGAVACVCACVLRVRSLLTLCGIFVHDYCIHYTKCSHSFY